MKKLMPWLVGALTLAILAGAGLAIYQGLAPDEPDPDNVPVESIRLESPPSEDDIQKMDPQPLEGDMIVPSVSMSADLQSMSEVNGVINPPGLESAYMLRGHGSPGQPNSGTTFIAIHSVQGANLPGNKLIDVDAARSALDTGDAIEILGHKYRVTNSHTVDKTDIGSQEGLWDEVDGKLVVLTCLQRTQGRSLQNVVIEAEEV